MSQDFDWMLGSLKALADESRLKILGLLSSRECSVEELAALVSLKAPTVSHHLSRLREASLVRMRSDGNTHLYRLDERGLGAIRKHLGSKTRVAGRPALHFALELRRSKLDRGRESCGKLSKPK